jgi:hypothetical protein
MATIATQGKLASAPAISAALFQQDTFNARQTRFSLTPRLYFYDQDGKTLAFVRNLSFHWNKELRVFSDPTLSFELLTITPTKTENSETTFSVFDPVNNEPVGKVSVPRVSGMQRQEWSLFDLREQHIGQLQENSVMLAVMRRYLSAAFPQTYEFYGENCLFGTASLRNGIFSPEMEIDLRSDREKRLDRRLVVAALVLVLAGRKQ